MRESPHPAAMDSPMSSASSDTYVPDALAWSTVTNLQPDFCDQNSFWNGISILEPDAKVVFIAVLRNNSTIMGRPE